MHMKQGRISSHSVRYRINIAAAKAHGYFKDTPWSALLRLMPTSTLRWDPDLFARPLARMERHTQFSTPLGNFWAPHTDRKDLGATAIEILSGVYEYGKTHFEAQSIVIDLGANLGTFTRLALDRGCAK